MFPIGKRTHIMDLHQIEIFCTVIRLRSFSKAADMLYLTQPTVSSHIKNLEQELGVELIDRLGKHAVPTEAGEILHRYGLKLLALRDSAQQEIEAVSGKVAGRLTIGGSTIPGAYVLPSLIASFRNDHPSAAIQLVIDDTAKITQAVLNSELNIGIIGARVKDPHLETHVFLRDELVVAVSIKHRWSGRKAVSPHDLREEPFILREQGSGTRRIMEERLARAGVPLSGLNAVAVMGSSDAVRQAVKAGLGISILSIRAIADDVRAGSLAALRVKGVVLERNFSIILLKNRNRSTLCRAFLDFLLKGSKK
ncbi:MAG TPA: selenium metabolism-associated LysR family transcriptional regulator [Nitrospirota bacterium]|nr:selenium metabolism-associated LysR family transcriptional regulator [Nitrospirota bacterium]